jgi:S-DNA-T family DNA segregation ATPase FtsK/SpoIIIE
MFLGYFSESVNFLGGTFGYQINDWLALTLGSFGSIVLICCIGYLFSLIVFNVRFSKLISFFKKTSSDSINEDDLAEINSPEDLEVVNLLSEEQKISDDIAESIDLNEEEQEIEPISEIVDLPEDSQKEELEINPTAGDSTLDTGDDEFSITVAESPLEDEVLSETEVSDIQKEYGEYDPKLDLSSYTLPSIDLLNDYGGKSSIGSVDKAELEENKNKIVTTLQNYKIEISKIMATVGPTVTLYEIVPAPGVRISKIKNLEDDIALSLAALGIRIIAPIPGKGTIGIEVPNSKPEMVSMRSLIASKKFQESDHELPVVMGKTITNETYTFDLTKMPHLLVAGATGQGKSVGLNAILVSILYKKHPAQVKFVLVDPKKVELTLYNKIERHFLAKLPDEEDAIITDTSKVVNTMNSLCIEMDERYELLKSAQVRTIKEYNTKFVARKLNPENGHRYLPYIVVLIDEFADLIMTAGKEIEQPIARIAQLARAIGIHLIVATQRPSVNVITGMIKANFPARIAFRVLSKIDSRTILDGSGADQLIGRGDMLVSNGQETVRLQCGFVDTPEVEDICSFIGDQRGYPEALLLPEYVGESAEGGGSMDDEDLDLLFPDAARIVVIHQQGSASLLQRKLKLGYNRAGRIIDQLEVAGIIGPFKGSKARDVLYSDEQQLEEFLASKGLI